MRSETLYCQNGSIGIIYQKNMGHWTKEIDVLTTEEGKHNILNLEEKHFPQNLIRYTLIILIYLNFYWLEDWSGEIT